MKKFTKMLALGMAAALVFGMTVNAAPSPDTEDQEFAAAIVNGAIKEGTVCDSNGEVVEGLTVEATILPEDAYNENFGMNYEEAIAKVDDNDAINEAISNAFGPLGDGKKEVWRDIVEVTVDGVIPEGGLWVPVCFVEEGEGCVIAHWNGEAWEVLEVEVRDGLGYAHFPAGFSPVYYAVLTVTGEEKPEEPTPTNKPVDPTPTEPSTTPTSPKTGETVPVAGILAVICLAGAAVCAKKVRYNR